MFYSNRNMTRTVGKYLVLTMVVCASWYFVGSYILTGHFLFEENFHMNHQYAAYYAMLCFIPSAIVSGVTSQRLKMHTLLAFGAVSSITLLPALFWLKENEFETKWGYKDFTNAGMVHLAGGTCALILSKALSPRTGRYGAAKFIPGNTDIYSIVGMHIIWYSWLVREKCHGRRYRSFASFSAEYLHCIINCRCRCSCRIQATP